MSVVIKKRTVTEYQCGICKKLHKTMQEAKRCDLSPIEPAMFALGDRVKTKHNLANNKPIEGTIIEVIGPIIGYMLSGDKKRLTGIQGHVFRYRVEYPSRFGGMTDIDVWTSDIVHT